MQGQDYLDLIFQCIDTGMPAIAPKLKNFMVALINGQPKSTEPEPEPEKTEKE